MLLNDAMGLDAGSLVTKCEEFESQVLDGSQGAPPEAVWLVYMLALFCEKRVVDAVHLWRRVTNARKVSQTPESETISTLGKNLREHDFATAIQTLTTAALPAEFDSLKALLLEKCRQDYMDLAGKAYFSIQIDVLCANLGLELADVLVLCQKKNWTIDDTTSVVLPNEHSSQKNSLMRSVDPSMHLDGVGVTTNSILRFERASIDVTAKKDRE